LRSASGTIVFNGTAVAPGDFAYDAPADVGAIVGDWNMIGLDGAPASISIAAGGIAVSPPGRCRAGRRTLIPRRVRGTRESHYCKPSRFAVASSQASTGGRSCTSMS
jgi:hypothetical protein